MHIILLSFLLLLSPLIAPLKAQSTQPVQPTIDLGTILWVHTMRARPDLAPPGVVIAPDPVQERYNQLVAAATRRKSSPQAQAPQSLPVSGDLQLPVLDPADSTARPTTSSSAQVAGPASPRITRLRPTGIRLTPYELCLRDGGCDGLTAAPPAPVQVQKP